MGKLNYFRLAQRALNEALTQGALTASVLVGVHLCMTAQAELVFESSAPAAVQTSAMENAPTREAVHEDRQNLRQVLNSSQKAEATNNSTAQVNVPQIPQTHFVTVPTNAQQVTTPQVTTMMVSPPLAAQATVPSQQSLSVLTSVSSTEPHTFQNGTPSAEVVNFSKAELMRRERVREEVRNEDLLQERLEELRLRDEKRRTDQMVGAAAPLSGATVFVAPAEAPLPPMPVVEERVGTMATAAPTFAPANSQVLAGTGGANRPVVFAQNTQYGAPNSAAGMQAQPIQPVVYNPAPSDQLATGQSSAMFVNANTLTTEHAQNAEDKTAFWITPKFGVSNMAETDGLNTQGRYTAGVGFGVGISENLSFDLGYQFSEYGVGLSNSNPYQAYQPYGYNANNQTRSYKQNVVDAGIKLHFLGTQAKVRPFVGGGGAWSKSFLNYDAALVKAYNQMGLGNMAQDYEVSSFLGYLSTGLDIRLSKSVSLGAIFKYYRPMSSHENQNLSYYGLSSYGVSPNSDNATVGGSLAKESFYTILAGVSFQF